MALSLGKSLWAAVAIAFALPLSSIVAADSHPIIPGFERFYTGGKADAAKGGQLLLSELNCVSCHRADSTLGHKQAPILDEVASRIRISYLRKFLTDPQAVKPGTTMPKVLADDPKREQKIDAIVHFLAANGGPKPDRPDLRGIILGRDLYGKVGCVACHGPRDGIGQSVATSAVVVPLGDLKAKYSIAGLASFLEHPHKIRPSGRMPQLLNTQESKEVANYLLAGRTAEFSLGRGTTTFSYYEGSWENLPDFNKLKQRTSGVCNAFDLGIALRENDYAIRFDGAFKAEQDGNYRFTLNSDDGSKLWVDGKLVVDDDGVHPTKAADGSITLKKGAHRISVGFFQLGGGAELFVTVQGPGLPMQDLGPLMATTEANLDVKPKAKPEEDLVWGKDRDELIKTGRALFASVGCANCHELHSDRAAIASEMKAHDLSRLKPEGGCLTGAKGSPRFGLSLAQQAALAAAIKNPPKISTEPAEIVVRTMQTLNCYACHARDKIGAPEDELNKQFQTSQPEMGDEARMPPPLDGVGAKLNPDYLRQLLANGVHDRPYMLIRMPGFGSANVASIADAFAALDKTKPVPPTKFETAVSKVKAAGRFLVGAQSLSCIKCHTFAGQRAEGVQGMDMTIMTKRLQRDWFQRYLLDPQAIRPGTRMPGSWPNGVTFYPDLLGGKVDAQIEAVWVYLKDGTGAQWPIGLGRQSIPLMPKDGAIIYRNFIQGAGPRAIAVGYPEKLSLAFDANQIRLALLWQGAFIDAARHWTDRGSGFEGPLGDDILKLPAGVPFAVLTKLDLPWPTAPIKEQGWRFDGYRLTPDDRPTFLYSHDDLKVEDFPNPTSGKEPTMRRKFKLFAAKPLNSLYYRAAVADHIESLENGWFKIDGWKMKIEGASAAIRKSDGKMELLVAIDWKNGKSEFVQEYSW
jgi:mono/diheme cytochrome c family protein